MKAKLVVGGIIVLAAIAAGSLHDEHNAWRLIDFMRGLFSMVGWNLMFEAGRERGRA